MSENKQRKTDRRTLYAQQVIKESLLELLSHMPFEKINITGLCKQAEISRATFYIHFLKIAKNNDNPAFPNARKRVCVNTCIPITQSIRKYVADLETACSIPPAKCLSMKSAK